MKGLPTHPDLQKRSYRLTVATLAREARVGRNAIYTNHRSMIDELRRASDCKIVPEKLATEGKWSWPCCAPSWTKARDFNSRGRRILGRLEVSDPPLKSLQKLNQR